MWDVAAADPFVDIQRCIESIQDKGYTVTSIIFPPPIYGTTQRDRLARTVIYRNKRIVLREGTSPVLWLIQQLEKGAL
jgi:hypothetical protein